ncbi:hypothetical protein NTE_03183 [Candidatus Nitrososphaera evergladensis SR1]|uniref:C2H2-type domain-containing protein n=1 Tax=Candidatus Nitrososphaera evergladensis SR1 TaxID=1459636 RepID=A0A075MVN1_9ARCH|nr:hypothetical protein [Candidatus Nitrososphaera evergladensis]AIF85213.1 hypothetical protein NTE_03183 [Candidatus Nitrososphaera evergladensis SR1]
MTFTLSKYFAGAFKAKPEKRHSKYRWPCYMCQLSFDDLQEREEHVRTVHYGEVE